MGLLSEIQSSLSDAFDTDLEDVVVNIRLFKPDTIGEYDVSTGTKILYPRQFESRGIFSAYPDSKIDGVNIVVGDEKITIISSEIEEAPEVDDSIFIDSGIEYNVVRVKKVLGGGSVPAIYIVQVRTNG